MRVDELIAGLDVRLTDRPAGAVRVCDITEDSRTVMPGSLYVARRGEHADGRDFVKAAVEAGAVAVLTDDPAVDLPHGHGGGGAGRVALLVTPDIPLAAAFMGERFYGSPSSKLALVGVTGTNGKTTTTYLVHQALNGAGVRCGLIGTVAVDDGTEVAPASMTTPPSLEISRTLARMLEAGCRAAVLEVSSHSLVQQRVAALKFDVGVFTNLTGDHLDYHRTMKQYGAAKAQLFGMLPPGGTAITNAEDPHGAAMVAQTRARVLRCGLEMPGMECGASVEEATRWETLVKMRGPWGEFHAALPYVGGHNLMNALQAAAAVHAACGCLKLADLPEARRVDATAIGRGLSQASLPPGRLECLTSPADPVTVYVDYAHTDDALRTVLQVLSGAAGAGQQGEAGDGGKLWVVFGCGGDRDATKRPRMGLAAAELADRVVVTSDNPRTEDPRSIIDAIVSGIPLASHEKVTIEPDRERAIRGAIAKAGPGDMVLIAGKGHEDYQILPAPPLPTTPTIASTDSGARTAVGGVGTSASPRARTTIRRHFDDRLVAEKALRLRGIEARPRVVTRGGRGIGWAGGVGGMGLGGT
jgi:UDP-N-acetylmuramoyl-L-alanyl-D-glutamate--2,6-diaminopimelate ligase